MNVSRRHAAALAALAALCAAAPATASDGHGPSSLPGAAIEHATPNSAVGQLTGGTAPAPAGGDAPAGGPSNGGAPAPSGCDYPAARQVFAPWHDQIAYVAAQNGGLEQGAAGWLLDGGAGVTEGNEPFALNASTDHQSLALPAGSSATSPATCVTAGQPIFRFVARTSGDRHARLRVEVVYSTPRGNSVSLVVGKLRGGDAWAPTKRLAVRLGRARSHGVDTSSSIAFRFTPVGAGDWQVDDVMLDPRARS
jgi:hypothetical protein